MSYPLYHTLNKNLKKSDLTATQKTALLAKLTNLDQDTKKAIIMLIIEHSKVADEMSQEPDNIVLPYGMVQVKENVQIEFENLPIPLRWIIWKFMNIQHS